MFQFEISGQILWWLWQHAFICIKVNHKIRICSIWDQVRYYDMYWSNCTLTAWFNMYRGQSQCLSRRWVSADAIKISRTHVFNSSLSLSEIISASRFLWQALRKSVQERHQKSDASQDEKISFFVFTILTRRSVAFQPCITPGGVCGVKLMKQNIFSKKVV